jgi:hypothetical protein
VPKLLAQVAHVSLELRQVHHCSSPDLPSSRDNAMILLMTQ